LNVPCKFAGCLLIVVFPAALVAADNFGGMLYTTGTAWVNGTTVPHSSSVYPGNSIQTRADSATRIAASGSSLVIYPDSVVRFRSDGVQLDQGGVIFDLQGRKGGRWGYHHQTQATLRPLQSRLAASRVRYGHQEKANLISVGFFVSPSILLDRRNTSEQAHSSFVK
jgi:hypothetical protein